MLSFSTLEQLVSGKSLSEICTLKSAFELLTGGNSFAKIEAEEWAYLKGQIAVIEKGMLGVLTGSNGEDAAASITSIVDLTSVSNIKAQLESVLKTGIESKFEQPVIDKVNSLIDLAAAKIAELTGTTVTAAESADTVTDVENDAKEEVAIQEAAVTVDAEQAVTTEETKAVETAQDAVGTVTEKVADDTADAEQKVEAVVNEADQKNADVVTPVAQEATVVTESAVPTGDAQAETVTAEAAPVDKEEVAVNAEQTIAAETPATSDPTVDAEPAAAEVVAPASTVTVVPATTPTPVDPAQA